MAGTTAHARFSLEPVLDYSRGVAGNGSTLRMPGSSGLTCDRAARRAALHRRTLVKDSYMWLILTLLVIAAIGLLDRLTERRARALAVPVVLFAIAYEAVTSHLL